MATVAFQGAPVNLCGELPKVGESAPKFGGVKGDLTTVHLPEFLGKKVVLNIFPSLDTPVCAASVRRFNKEAASLENTVVLCVSKDLPFAQSRFCTTEGLDDVVALADASVGADVLGLAEDEVLHVGIVDDGLRVDKCGQSGELLG